MNEQEIRKIVQDEIARNTRSGSPSIPPHDHEATSNIQITPRSIQGFQFLDNSTVGVIRTNTVIGTNFATSYVGPNVIYPIPQVYSGVAGSFGGGNAPDGMLLADATAGVVRLALCLGNTWYETLMT